MGRGVHPRASATTPHPPVSTLDSARAFPVRAYCLGTATRHASVLYPGKRILHPWFHSCGHSRNANRTLSLTRCCAWTQVTACGRRAERRVARELGVWRQCLCSRRHDQRRECELQAADGRVSSAAWGGKAGHHRWWPGRRRVSTGLPNTAACSAAAAADTCACSQYYHVWWVGSSSAATAAAVSSRDAHEQWTGASSSPSSTGADSHHWCSAAAAIRRSCCQPHGATSSCGSASIQRTCHVRGWATASWQRRAARHASVCSASVEDASPPAD